MKIKRKDITMTVYTTVQGIRHIQILPHRQMTSEGTIKVSLIPTPKRLIGIQVPIDAVSSFLKDEKHALLDLDDLCYVSEAEKENE